MSAVPFNPRKYAAARWTECGRIYPTLDCWGFVRAVLRECAGVDVAEFCGATAKTMTKKFNCAVAEFEELPARVAPNHAVCCFFTPAGALCHVGIVEGGRVWQLDKNRGLISDPTEKFFRPSVKFFMHKELKNASKDI